MSRIDSISIVIPVAERGADLINLFEAYQSMMKETGIKHEFVIVLIPEFTGMAEELEQKTTDTSPTRIILLNRSYGEAGLLKVAIEHTEYNHILTLPAYEQVSPAAIPAIFNSLEDNDALVVNRWPRIDPMPNRLQSLAFRAVLKMMSYSVPKDPGSGIRLARKEVFEEIKLYGDMHRFFLLLTDQAGFKSIEYDIPQSESDAYRRFYGFRTYLSRALDILTVSFLTRFNKKPLRFFGSAGAFSAFLGLAGLGFLAFQRLFLGISLGDRPLLVLFSLFLVLGIQLIAIGLVGETISFINSKDDKEYRIKKIIN